MRSGRLTGWRTALLAAGALLLAACGSGGGGASGDSDALVLYNAQHRDLMEEMVAGFTAQTGIEVKVRKGDDSEMSNQLVQEGDRTPADVFVTENSPAMALVAREGGFAKVAPATLAQVPPRFAAADGSWVGFAARATVFAYNTTQVKAAELPASILDLAKPAWKGRFGFSPSGADFQAIAAAVLALEGEAGAKAWLAGLKANGVVYNGQVPLLAAVDAGEVPAAVLYHYYWHKDRAESGANSDSTALHYFGKQDPGAFVSVSGAGVLKASDRPDEAQQLVAYLTSRAGQEVLAKSSALEYTVASDVPAAGVLKPLSSLAAPDVAVGDLDGPATVALMQQVGLL
ncbi:MAG: extracellular solute-binding protein family 1 [Frankiales bacterium]|nr:extracellular solute-binding protein family 1 [Frankiales bacterium]